MDCSSITPDQMVKALRYRGISGLSQKEVIELCFAVMKQHSEIEEQCRAAVILSGIIAPGLGDRALAFLDEHPQMPDRVHDLLNGNFLRMNS